MAVEADPQIEGLGVYDEKDELHAVLIYWHETSSFELVGPFKSPGQAAMTCVAIWGETDLATVTCVPLCEEFIQNVESQRPEKFAEAVGMYVLRNWDRAEKENQQAA